MSNISNWSERKMAKNYFRDKQEDSNVCDLSMSLSAYFQYVKTVMSTKPLLLFYNNYLIKTYVTHLDVYL